jgi:predicted nucleic acid-binding protein
MQRVVSDSDLIIHLAKLNKLDLIRELYEYAHIPRYVELEMVRYQYDEVGIIEEAVRHGVLKVYETDDSKARSIAGRYGIHIGEAHVKGLAEELHAEIFLSNERKVRIAAKEEGFFVAGTVGVILRGANQGCLTKEEAIRLLNKLKTSGFRIHPNIISSAIDSLEELE